MILLRAWSAHASQLVNTADCGKWIATAGHGWATAILATCFPCLRDPAYQCRIERRKALTAQTPALVSRITVANMTSRRALVTIVTQLLVWVLSGHKLGTRDVPPNNDSQAIAGSRHELQSIGNPVCWNPPSRNWLWLDGGKNLIIRAGAQGDRVCQDQIQAIR
jgi:hypothetical protein